MQTLQEEITIHEILAEADAYGLKHEVRESAERIWEENKDDEEFTLLDAYHLAFLDWIK
jgi:hypothetical protein